MDYPIAVAAGGTPAFLTQLVALLVAAALIGYFSARVRIVPIVGFLLAGVLIGPNALGLVSALEVVNAAAEIGVILLLFSIGIEFSLDRLSRLKTLILVGGTLQVVTSVAVVTGVLMAFGVPWRASVFTGFLVALSSTAIVLKLLGSRGETGSATGQTGLAFLILQDLAVVAMVLLVPLLGGSDSSWSDLALALLRAAGVVAAVLIIARRVMPPLLEIVARTCSPEVFLLTVIAVCFGTAYLTSLAGVSVSLGAFLAGLMVSESRHSSHALGETLPLQILFSATFFVSVGMLLDVGFLMSNLPLVLAALALVLVVKLVTTAAAAVVVRRDRQTVIAVSLLLAQVGEFSFVLERAGRSVDLTPAGLGDDGSQAFIAATVLLMVATPWLAGAGRSLGRRWQPRAQPADGRTGEAAAGPTGEAGRRDHVVLLGYGDGAREVGRGLRARQVPFVVTTLNPDGATEAEARGWDVIRGDSTKHHVLVEAGVPRARMVVIGDDDAEMAARQTSVVRGLAPDATVVVRVDGNADLAMLAEAGVDKLVDATHSSATALSDSVRASIADGSRGERMIDPSRVVRYGLDPDGACPHLPDVAAVLPSAAGCEDCLRTGEDWVHLRLCLTCGHVGCCDSSPNRHARTHADAAEHPVVGSAEPDERWGWCYIDELELASAPDRGAGRT